MRAFKVFPKVPCRTTPKLSGFPPTNAPLTAFIANGRHGCLLQLDNSAPPQGAETRDSSGSVLILGRFMVSRLQGKRGHFAFAAEDVLTVISCVL